MQARRGVTVTTVPDRRPAGRQRAQPRPTGSAPSRWPRSTRPLVRHPCRAAQSRRARASSPSAGRAAPPTGTWSSTSAPVAQATVVLDHVGTTTLAANVEVLVGDGASLTVVTLQDWDDDAVHVERPGRPRRAGRQLRHVRRHPRRRARPAHADGVLRRARRRRRAARPLLHRRRPASGAPPVRRPRAPHCRSRVTYKGALQGEGAHSRLDRRRGHSPRTRSAPTPTSSTATWCSPTGPAPTRCPTWRSRPARSPGPGTPARPGGSTTRRCST